MRTNAFTFEVVRDNLASISEEMVAELLRIAYSGIIRNAHDCGAAVLDRQGQLVAQRAGTPGHFNSIPTAAKGILAVIPVETIEPGDVILTNDPWIAAGHLNDFFMFTPCFADGYLVGFCATVAHHLDVGGKNPGSTTPNTTELFQEGIQIPVLRYRRRGEVDQTLEALVKSNVRLPDLVISDMRAQVAVQERGTQRLKALCRKFGVETIEWVFRETMERSERLVRAGIALIPDGVYCFEDVLDDDGYTPGPLHLKVAVRVDHDTIHVDYTGCPEQRPAGINMTASYRNAYTHATIRCFLDKDIPHNEGCFRPITISAPEGTIVNPRKPAPVAGRGLLINRIGDLIIGALSQAVAHRRMAGYGGSLAQPVFSGMDPKTNRMFIFLDTTAGGLGGRHELDGESSVSFPYNVNHQPVEVLESSYPVRVRRFVLRQDSEGAGRWRGGFGVTKEYELLCDGVMVQNQGDRFFTPPWGLQGGLPATTQACFLERGERREALSSKGEYQLQAGDIFSVHTPGGGGLEPPQLRDPAQVAADVKGGYISRARARDIYGVVMTAGDEVNLEATERLRQSTHGGAKSS